jgi:hypothetical protein
MQAYPTADQIALTARQYDNNESDFKECHFDDAAWGQAIAADYRLERPDIPATHKPWLTHIRRGIFDPESNESVCPEEVRVRRYCASGQAMALEFHMIVSEQVSPLADRWMFAVD